jgi:DNA-directed RNA polymerase subunit RPC12/RpoP
MDMNENPNYYFVEKPYKSKYICVKCRKVFKRQVLSDVSKETVENEPKCPQCGEKTFWVGPKFRAPKSDNIKAWSSIHVLNDLGILNFIGFASNKITIPATNKALKDMLIETRQNCEWTINKYVSLEYDESNKTQIHYFSDTIKKIDLHLKKL